MRDVVFVLAAVLGWAGVLGLLGELFVCVNAGNPEAGGAMMFAAWPLVPCVPVLVGLVFCYWWVRPTLTRREKLAVWALAAPELLSMAGLAVWLLLGNR